MRIFAWISKFHSIIKFFYYNNIQIVILGIKNKSIYIALKVHLKSFFFFALDDQIIILYSTVIGSIWDFEIMGGRVNFLNTISINTLWTTLKEKIAQKHF